MGASDEQDGLGLAFGFEAAGLFALMRIVLCGHESFHFLLGGPWERHGHEFSVPLGRLRMADGSSSAILARPSCRGGGVGFLFRRGFGHGRDFAECIRQIPFG